MNNTHIITSCETRIRCNIEHTHAIDHMSSHVIDDTHVITHVYYTNNTRVTLHTYIDDDGGVIEYA
jgi:hypothetical protein